MIAAFITANPTSSFAEASEESCIGVGAALGILLAVLVIGLVISLTVNVILSIQRKRERLLWINKSKFASLNKHKNKKNHLKVVLVIMPGVCIIKKKLAMVNTKEFGYDYD